MNKHSSEHGYTMFETILYISLLIILAGTIAKTIGNVFTTYKTGRVNQQIIDMRKAIIQYTAAFENYGSLTKEAMLGTPGSATENPRRNSFPFDMKNGFHALNGRIKLGSSRMYNEESGGNLEDEAKAIHDYMFFVSFSGIPFKSCVEILTQGQFYGEGAELDTLIINGPDVPAESGDPARVNNDPHAWQYPYSLFDLDGIVSSDRIKVMNVISDGNLNAYSRPTITDAMSACKDNKHNVITWIFS